MTDTTSILSKGKILVTGASGFVGSHIYNYLREMGYDVIGQQYSKTKDNLVSCDLTDYNQTWNLLEGVDYVFIVATKTYGASVCTSSPNSLVRDGIVMNANLLDACYKRGVKKVMFISSSVVYQHGFKPFAEDDLDLNKDPYKLYLGVGWVKRYTEQLCRFYNSLGMNINIVRPTNIYGDNDKYEENISHFIPAIIKRCLEAKDELVVWGSGNNLKDLIFVDDFVRDILLVFESYNSVEPVNICSGETYTIREIVKEIARACGFVGKIVYDPSKPDSVPYKELVKNKFNSLFGKQWYTPLRCGIEKTVLWMEYVLRH